MNIDKALATTIVCFCTGALIGMAINWYLKNPDEKEERLTKEILVCESGLGETVPGGKGYPYIYRDETAAWCMMDESLTCEYYQQVPGEVCRVEPFKVIAEGQ